MQKMREAKLITCIVPNHITLGIIETLSKEKGIIMANKSNARGSSYTTHFAWIEMEMLEVIIEADRADEIYAYLFDKVQIGSPNHGLIFQHALSTATHYTLP